jgi:hypothetical protein
MSNSEKNSSLSPAPSESLCAVPHSDTVSGLRAGLFFMEGWIKLYRKIRDNWIWQDPVKFQWWIDILLEVNHSLNKVAIGFEVYECKRGQSVRSLQGWANRWGVSKDTARNFLMMLEKDGMILHESLKKTTRITVCNYDTYQIEIHDKQTNGKRQANDKQTTNYPNKNENNDKNEENEKNIFKAEVFSFTEYPAEMLNAFYAYWVETDKKGRMRWQKQDTWELKLRLIYWHNRNKKSVKSW